MRKLFSHLSFALVAASTLGGPAAGSQVDPSGTSSFVVFMRGQRIGTEDVTVTRSPDGWLISSSGRTGPPLDFSFETFLARYTTDWQPRSLEISGQMRGQALLLTTMFQPAAIAESASGPVRLATATSDVVQSGKQARVTHQVSAQTIALPNNFYGAYEALALRLGSTPIGSGVQIYVAPQSEVTATVDRVTSRRLETPTTTHELRQFDITFRNPAGPLKVEVWVDARGRLARMAIPVAAVAVMREDLVTVMARLDAFNHARDEDLFIPANGFSLAATMTRPPAGAPLAPVVILVAGSGQQDRDETLFGVPILGQIAGHLSDAGYFVVRYDKRGVGQSGGRPETGAIDAYATDVRSVVEWLRRRKDVDRDRIAVVGYSEGGAVALLAAGQQRGRIKAVGLIAAPGQTGREITVLQQQRALDKLTEPAAAKQEKIDLQARLMDAVIGVTPWTGLPPELKKQADSQWFRSWLTFDPAAALRRVNQPVLILHGALDTQIPPDQAARLTVLSDARKLKSPLATRTIVVPGVNHLLVPARTGESEEYATLPIKTVSPEILGALTTWLKDVLRKMN